MTLKHTKIAMTGIGTVGHVDHSISTLAHEILRYDPDIIVIDDADKHSLQEIAERDRGIEIQKRPQIPLPAIEVVGQSTMGPKFRKPNKGIRIGSYKSKHKKR